MKRRAILLALAALFILCDPDPARSVGALNQQPIVFRSDAEAEEERASSKKPRLNAAVLIGFYEGLFALNSGLATLSPRGYGAVGLVLLPLSFSQSGGSRERIAAASLFAGLCIYNLTLPDRQDLSSSQVFVHNMIGWHLFALGVGATSFFSDDKNEKKQQAMDFGLSIGPDGPMLVGEFRF